MSIFTILHRNLHDFPLIFRATFKRLYLVKNWGCLTKSLDLLKKDSCIILVNGPSLTKDITAALKEIRECSSDVMCVNYSALTDIFLQVKPNLYTLADPMFWREDLTSEFIDKNEILFNTLKSADWKITFLIPEEGLEIIKKKIGINNLHNFIAIPVNTAPLKNKSIFLLMLDKMICTPIFGNVLILSLYYAIICGYKNISIYGADFDVFKQYQTDQFTNEVYSGGVHFYDQSYKPESSKYLNRPNKMMHIRLEQARNAFYQIYMLSKLAKKRKVSLQNKSSFSLIDSLDRNTG